MSIIIGNVVGDIQLETQTVGVKVSNADIILGFKRANNYLNSTYKMPTSQRLSDLLVFPGVFEYPAPSDFLGWFEPRRPLGTSSPWFVNTSENELVHTYKGRQLAFKFDHENLFLLVNDNVAAQSIDANGDNSNLSNANVQIINSMDSLTANGTVTISGDGSALVSDTQIFVEGSASIQFTITGSSGTTTITITPQAAVDLTGFLNLGYIFHDLYCPATNTSAITKVVLRLGSDLNNYYSFSTTTRYRGDSILNNWGLLGYNFNAPTTVGTPDVTNLTYVQIIITNPTSGANGVYRLDNLFAANPVYYQLPYYSKFNVKNAAGSYIQFPTTTTDQILCPEDANEALIFQAISHIMEYNMRNPELAQYFAQKAEPFENILRIKYPVQERRIQGQYFRSPSPF